MRNLAIRMLRLFVVVLLVGLTSCAASKGMVLKAKKNPKLDKTESLLLFTITTNDKTPKMSLQDNNNGLLYIIPAKKPPLRFDVILEKKITLSSPGSRAFLVSLELPSGNYRMQKLILKRLSFQVDIGELSFSVPRDSTIYLGNINIDYVEDFRTPDGVYLAQISVNDMFTRDLELFENEYNGALKSLEIHNGVHKITGSRSFNKVIKGFTPI